MHTNARRVSAIAGAAVLALGIAGPAYATETGSDPTANHAPAHAAPTLAQVKAWLTTKIDDHLAWIEKAEARVVASTKLTAAQKADVTKRLAAQATALATLKTQIAAATTKAEIDADLKAAVTAGTLFWGHRCGHGHLHGWHGAFKPGDPAKGTTAKPTAATLAARTPTSYGAGTHTVTVRSELELDHVHGRGVQRVDAWLRPALRQRFEPFDGVLGRALGRPFGRTFGRAFRGRAPIRSG